MSTGEAGSHGFRQSIILRSHLGNIQSKSLLGLSLLLSWGFGLLSVRFQKHNEGADGRAQSPWACCLELSGHITPVLPYRNDLSMKTTVCTSHSS